jgi:hypothetical protein
VKILKAGTVVAWVPLGEASACLADWHEQQRFGAGARPCSQASTRPGAHHGPRPLCASSISSSWGKELLALRLAAGTGRDPQMTGWQAIRSRSVNCTGPAAPAAVLR